MSLLAYEFASGFHGLKGSVAAFVGDYLNEPTVGSANGLFRRAIGDEPVTIYSGLPLEPEGAPNSRFAVALLTGLIGFLGVALIQYTFKVVLTLAIVESPPAISLPIGSEDLDGRNRKPAAVLGMDTPKTYITSSIRGTIKHLRLQAGAFALWRGWNANLAFALSFAVTRVVFTGILGGFLPQAIARPVAGFLSFMSLAGFAMTCTHIIISKPQPETWVSRLYNTPWATARRSLPAMAHFALLNIIPAELCAYAVKLNVHPAARSVIFILGLFVSVFVAFPAMVALIRVQASLLPDTQEAIVSFDRSFGKQDGMSAVSFKEALRSVGCAGWKRIYKLVIKTVLITLALAGVVVTIVGVEMIWVMAGAPKKELGSAFSLGV